MTTKEQHEAKMADSKRFGFNTFMKQPMTSAMLSLMPPSEHLEMMLKAAFEAGFGCGAVYTTIEVATMMMDGDRRR